MQAGYVAIVGLPNVGKSTLLNHLLNVKLSIVSRRPQTTRHKILGILTEGETQAVFIDTPGLIQPKYELQNAMVLAIKEALEAAEVVLWLTDIETDASGEKLMHRMMGRRRVLMAINKVDLVADKSRLLPRIEHYRQIGFDEVFLISALKGEGIDALKQAILNLLPEGTFFFPEDQLTEHPERFFVGELIRERIFETYGEEIPYATFVAVEEFKEREQRKYFIRATIYVEKESQKGIIIGRQGAVLKKVGVQARKAIELFLERPVYLELWVKVKKNWRKRRDLLKLLEHGEA
jgi:GTP-binding protein Era